MILEGKKVDRRVAMGRFGFAVAARWGHTSAAQAETVTLCPARHDIYGSLTPDTCKFVSTLHQIIDRQRSSCFFRCLQHNWRHYGSNKKPGRY
jgi:hypothetical protein